MSTQSLDYHGSRFPPEIISHAVWFYHRFCLSLRDVEELLAERGVHEAYAIRKEGPVPPAGAPSVPRSG